jgi:FkbM family methyltransferase
MPLLKFRSPTLTALSALVPEINYVMCGAQGETGSRLMRALPQLKFIGFEPDRGEYDRLSRTPAAGFRYLNAAVGAREERRVLYVTRSAECSSLLPPNQQFFSRFGEQGSELEVVKKEPTDVVARDTCLPKIGVQEVHFLDLDTQGTELDILHGATNFLSTSVVGVKYEVEFSPLYEGQALFSDVDAYLRGFGFMLFDLSRTRYRRARFPARALTRGQLLWGEALYLRN